MNWQPFPILAFGFTSPLLLWGAALGAIPVVIHLLHKRKFHEMPWAAMRFLLEAARKNSRRIRLEQLLLMTVRVLILVLVALALSQPFFETIGATSKSDVPTHRVLVIDTSYSMGVRSDGESRFERAQQIAQQIVNAAQQGDALNLVRISEQPPRAIIRQPAYEKERVIEEVNQLSLTEAPGDLPETLEAVAELLESAPEMSRKEVIFLSDLQRASWFPDSNDQRAALRRSLKQISQRARITVIDLGDSNAANHAVTSFISREPFATVGRPIPLEATLRNFGPALLTQRLVELHIDDRLVKSQRIDLDPGVHTSIRFEYTFPESGEHRLELRLQNDSLEIDNRRWLSLPVRDSLNVLLVNGKPSGRPGEDAVHYLQTVLSPSTSEQPWRGFTRPRVISEGELIGTELGRYECVILSNVRMFTEDEAEILLAYVHGGGGLVFCLGDQVRAQNYNQMLWDNSQGLLPARLGERIGDATERDEVFSFDTVDLSHNIVRPFEGNPNRGLETTMTFEYVQAELAEKTQARVPLRFSSGDAAIVEAPVGLGRVVLVTTSVDTNWSLWPIQRSFPPLIHEIVKYAVSGTSRQRQQLVGQTITQTFSSRAFGMPVLLNGPHDLEESIPLIQSDLFVGFTFEHTDRSGLYEFKLGAPLSRSEWFAVNVNSLEGNLAKGDEQELATELLPGIDHVYRTGWRNRRRAVGSATTTINGPSGTLLVAVLCLLFVELLMGWKFFYGLLLLYVAVAAGIVFQTTTVSVAGAVLVGLGLCAGLIVIVGRGTGGVGPFRVPFAPRG